MRPQTAINTINNALWNKFYLNDDPSLILKPKFLTAVNSLLNKQYKELPSTIDDQTCSEIYDTLECFMDKELSYSRLLYLRDLTKFNLDTLNLVIKAGINY